MNAGPECISRVWSAQRLRLLGAAVAVFALSACFGHVHVPTGVIVIQGEPEGAVILVDDVARARISEGEAIVVVRPGTRRVSVTAEGYEEERLDLRVRSEDVLEVRVRLWPRLE